MCLGNDEDVKNALCNMAALASTEEVETRILRAGERWGPEHTNRSRPCCECNVAVRLKGWLPGALLASKRCC
jgi:hypothetical protein